jgi:hypothetical protein
VNTERPLMRIQFLPRFIVIVFAASFLFSCNEKEEFVSPENISDFIPLASGKYITYRVDSLVYTGFGRVTEIHSYQVKHQVDQKITDNLGRASYRVYRSIRDSGGTQPWQAAGSFFITPLEDQVEVIENNLRSIALHMPVQNAFSWKGFGYYTTDPYNPTYPFSNDDNIQTWPFAYEGDVSSFNYRNFNYNNVITVNQINQIILPDTLTVANNQVTIPDKATVVWINGISSDTVVTVNTNNNTNGRRITLVNISNKPAILNKIKTPLGTQRNYEYQNNNWTFGVGGDVVERAQSSYGAKSIGIERYAKGIGMVFREFTLWEHQPAPNNPAGPYKTGFGITMWMIDKN